MPSVNGVTDTGLLAHPHGIDIRPDLDLVVTSDYADPLSLATSATVRRGDRGLRHDRAVLEALGPEGRADGDRAGSRRQGPRGAWSRTTRPRGSCRWRSRTCTGTRACSPRPWAAAAIWYAPDATAAEAEVPHGLPRRPRGGRRRVHHHPGRPVPLAADPGDLVARRPGLQPRLSRRTFPPGDRPGHPKAAGAPATMSSATAPPVKTDADGIIRLHPGPQQRGRRIARRVTGKVSLNSPGELRDSRRAALRGLRPRDPPRRRRRTTSYS